MTCTSCGSKDLRPYTTKPPKSSKGTHICIDECLVSGLICWSCRLFKPHSPK